MNTVIKKIYSFLLFFKKDSNSLSQSLKSLRQKKFYPSTIIDIGVAKGTEPLYINFPKSFFY